MPPYPSSLPQLLPCLFRRDTSQDAPPQLVRLFRGTALVAVCQYGEDAKLTLPSADRALHGEAEMLSRVFPTFTLKDPSFDAVCRGVKGRRAAILLLSFHSAILPGSAEHTPVFVAADGRPEAHTPLAIASGLRAASRAAGDCLSVVVLNGCCTLELGKLIGEFVDYVFCWETVVHSGAARIAGTAFAAALANERRVPVQREAVVMAAYTSARAAVLARRTRGQLDNGTMADIPRYALDVDPFDASQVHVCRWTCRCRLTKHCRKKGRLFSRYAEYGSFAAGTPKLIVQGEVLDAPFPPLE